VAVTENNFEKRLADCERVIRELEETNNPQEQISLLKRNASANPKHRRIPE
jgi:hypothetical protein